MGKLSTYLVKSPPAVDDYLTGTDDPAGTPATKNFITQDIADLNRKFEKSVGFSGDLDTIRTIYFYNSTNIDKVWFDDAALARVSYQISTDGTTWTSISGDQTVSGTPPTDLNVQCNAQTGFFYLKLIITYITSINIETGAVIQYRTL